MVETREKAMQALGGHSQIEVKTKGKMYLVIGDYWEVNNGSYQNVTVYKTDPHQGRIIVATIPYKELEYITKIGELYECK